MTGGNEGPIETSDADVEPAEAFELLADPDRFEILATVAESTGSFRGTLTFSELYDRTGFADSGRFNYHLDKLVGPFLRKTEDGYGLRHAARIVYRLAVSGLLSDRGERDVTTVDAPCRRCGGPLEAVYEGDRFWVRCADCERRAAVGPFPPRALANHDPTDAPDAFDRYVTGYLIRAAENVCPWCASPLSPSLEPAGEDWPTVEWVLPRNCGHCHGFITTRLCDLLRFHPAVVAFYHDRGIDVLNASVWEVEAIMADAEVGVEASERAAEVTLRRDGGRLDVGLDESLRASTAEVLGIEDDRG